MATILFMGSFNALAGGREKNIPLDTIPTIASLIEYLGVDAPELAAALHRPTSLFVVNKNIVRGDMPIEEGDEIAFLPPMSGG